MTPFQRHAVVTGASRGIGRAIACRLAADGARVTFAYRQDDEGARQTARDIARVGGEALPVRTDVSTAEGVRELFEAGRCRFGSVHVVVNNVGVMKMALVQQLSREDWDAMFATNLTSAFLCTQAALPDMRKARWGRVIAIGSAAGNAGGIGQSCYSASKAALVGLMRSVARETAQWGITANVVSPGFVDTAPLAEAGNWARQKGRRVPIDRPCAPDEVAGMVAYLCSEVAGYVTGQNLLIDGGLVMT